MEDRGWIRVDGSRWRWGARKLGGGDDADPRSGRRLAQGYRGIFAWGGMTVVSYGHTATIAMRLPRNTRRTCYSRPVLDKQAFRDLIHLSSEFVN